MLIITTDEKEYHIFDNAFVSSKKENSHTTLVIGFTTDTEDEELFTTGRYFSPETASLAKEIWERKIIPLISKDEELYLPGIEERIEKMLSEYNKLLGYLGYID